MTQGTGWLLRCYPAKRDLRRLAGIVSEQRDDIPANGVPLSLLAGIAGQIRCDVISFEGFHSGREVTWFIDAIPAHDQTTDDVAEAERGRDLSYEVQHPLIRDVIYQDISGARAAPGPAAVAHYAEPATAPAPAP